ncbi:hypothetical protein ACFTXM_21880, partial [Streptomyces sp. NPDC056930]
MRRRILAEALRRPGEEGADLLSADLGVAPGCKVGGHAPWSFSDPFPMACPECGSDVRPLLTIDGSERDGGSGSRHAARGVTGERKGA